MKSLFGFPVKKGQMEIVGLVIIVILISLGMLFAARFALKEPAQQKTFNRVGLAKSAMTALMKTTIDPSAECATGYVGVVKPQIERDLLEDCAKNIQTAPENGPSLYRCKWLYEEKYLSPLVQVGEGLHSCVFVEAMIAKLLQETLGKWNPNYEFSSRLLETSGSTTISGPIKHGRGCQGERDTSGVYPISTEAGLIENVLYLCD